MKINTLPVTIFAICSIFVFSCLSCKQDDHNRSLLITPEVFPSSTTKGTQFRIRTKGIKSLIPVEVAIDTDTVIVRRGLINRSNFINFKID
jgi:hypothetical protein